MNRIPTYHPWLHRLSVATCLVALLPIVVGAIVTTVDAGMAFPDWPSSDGQGMLAYPWLQSVGDDFIEHGHRLAGLVIGVVSILLVLTAWIVEKRRSIRILSSLVLLGVVGQGLLGGIRVLWNDDRFAMIHGSFASWVFCIMAVLAMLTSRSWQQLSSESVLRTHKLGSLQHLKPLAILTPLSIVGQYAIGGLVRHLSTGLHEHIAGAVVVSFFCLATVFTGMRSGYRPLKRSSLLLLAFLILQVTLGAGAWITRFGLASFAYVAVQGSVVQVVVRTSHTVVGMMLLMSAVLYSVRLFRLAAWQASWISDTSKSSGPSLRAVSVGGGVR